MQPISTLTVSLLTTGGKKTGNQWASSASAAGGLGWCEEDDGGWREGPPATGSGWTDPSEFYNKAKIFSWLSGMSTKTALESI